MEELKGWASEFSKLPHAGQITIYSRSSRSCPDLRRWCAGSVSYRSMQDLYRTYPYGICIVQIHTESVSYRSVYTDQCRICIVHINAGSVSCRSMQDLHRTDPYGICIVQINGGSVSYRSMHKSYRTNLGNLFCILQVIRLSPGYISQIIQIRNLSALTDLDHR